MKKKSREEIIGSRVELVVKETTIANKGSDVIVISGYANRYLDQNGKLVVDRSEEAVLPQGYDIESFMKNPILLYSHQKDQPIGTIINIDIRVDGLYIEAEVHKFMNERAFYGVQNGILKTFSIGFMIKDYAEVDDVYLWTATELLEVSIVSVPDNQESLFSVLTDAPCQSGVCLLGNKAVSKESIVKHNKSFKTKEWSSVDKTDLKEALKDKDESIVKDAYLIVKDVSDTETWKFPHHDFIDGVLVTNIGGLKSAFSALKSVQGDDILSKADKLAAAEHLKGHFAELMEEGLVEEALLLSVVEFIDSLDNTETKDTDDMKVTKEEGTETVEENENQSIDIEGSEGDEGNTETSTEQTEEDDTINTPEDAEKDESDTQEPNDGESESTSDSIEVGLTEVESFIGAAKATPEGIEQLFMLYAELESVLNEALTKNEEEE